MWILILAFSAAISSILWYSRMPNDELMYGYLSLILWGGTLMVLVDRIFAYSSGEPFLELTLESAVKGFFILNGAMIIWLIILIVKDPKRVLFKKKYK